MVLFNLPAPTAATERALVEAWAAPGSPHRDYFPILPDSLEKVRLSLGAQDEPTTEPSRGPMTPLLTWVHLSDIHAGHGDATQRLDQKLIMKALAADLAGLEERDGLVPDLILVTGDLAYSGGDAAGEYDVARTWLTQIATSLNCSPEEIFLVAGNHDVSWAADKKNRNLQRQLKSIRRGDDTLDAALDDAGDREQLLQRQQPYLNFAESFAPASAHPFWHHTQTFNGLKVRLVGLNTALLAKANDAGQLDLGLAQWQPAVDSMTKDELVVVLSHHPLSGGWLRDEKGWRKRLLGAAHVHLAGHIHEGESEETRSGSGTQLVSIVAGAAHAPSYENVRHGYNVAAVYPGPNGTLQLRIWPRIWSEDSQAFRTDIDEVPDRAYSTTHALSLKNPASAP